LKVSKNIQEIYWDSNIIGTKGIKLFIEGIRSSPTLRELSIKNTGIGNPGLRLLAEGLRDNETLKGLDISSNSITFESFADLCDALNYNKIRNLKARNNLLGDESMKYFSDLILSEGSYSELVQFDFSSSKIYDQGLIFLLNKLQNNKKICKIKLRDNYFSHEIDHVVVDFLDKNTKLTSLDLSKNRFSLQCLQKIQNLINRNIKIQNDKEPNKLLVEVYRLKYENTKLNEMKETLKNLENVKISLIFFMYYNIN
jgi:Ran GTPase-activating protein (RanGAP) involved in mRNA processing and transport